MGFVTHVKKQPTKCGWSVLIYINKAAILDIVTKLQPLEIVSSGFCFIYQRK